MEKLSIFIYKKLSIINVNIFIIYIMWSLCYIQNNYSTEHMNNFQINVHSDQDQQKIRSKSTEQHKLWKSDQVPTR